MWWLFGKTTVICSLKRLIASTLPSYQYIILNQKERVSNTVKKRNPFNIQDYWGPLRSHTTFDSCHSVKKLVIDEQFMKTIPQENGCVHFIRYI